MITLQPLKDRNVSMPIQYQEYPELSIEQRNRLFANYADRVGAFLFDSGKGHPDLECDSDDENARYDIIAVEPIQIISGKNEDIDNPLQYFKEQLQSISQDTIPEELRYLPCIGGLFYALSYELGKYYEKLSSSAVDDLQLADYFAGLYGSIIIIDRIKHCSFVICSDERQLSLYQELNMRMRAVLNNNETSEQSFNLQTFNLQSKWQANLTAAEYATAFNRVKEYIQAGDCYQVNLAQRFMASCSGSSWAAYLKLSAANQAPFSAFINTGEADILSLSPERFIKLRGKDVETKPIKGTRPRGLTPELDKQLEDELINSKKDQAENLMIVDLMRNDLGRSCSPGSIKVPELFKLESFHSVHHLVSTIQGQLDESEDAFSLMAHCFPGGSITGTPKIRAMNIIDELEPHRRSYYCGSLGYIDKRGYMDSNISIRTLVRKDDKLYCWAGGGLVSESKLAEEYQETFDKVSRILPILE
ncbi:MAG: para-aminobenzoate synthetase component 1 [Enterobacterales bacterium]|jgi:para-aminobenzoate synthetase component 1